ncbi:3-oxoacyl-[acyl-carrier-protein] reductase [Clostridium collagenovorans DSM 3089]|uniref:3-oxoacyl-[acyl-carrier-protein] reductase n=1 Tax=Clostridium collagenovorans DSM 3089 TaxID=1121306 RepID=A0A1M5X9A5_9CLOT|nr:3-oxoacyl-[acyl-carrier-protein] reductase [Clostridium collagenovorans]SHH96425.1 3-oxoacyl-[acyl-carrier-protein] reductase [Clostridium collagenovorans DSM 3089]
MLKGKIAMVTGAGRGIGKAIALKLADLGASIALNYRTHNEDIDKLAKEIEDKNVKVLLVQGDVSDFNQCSDMIKKVNNELGRIDILVNNAGITKDGLLMRMKEEDFDKVIDINLKGTFNCIKHVTPIMMKQREGRIINLSSVIGLVGNAGQANYAASKAGIIGLTKSVAKEIGSRGVTVNAIAPGFIKTDMTEVLSDKVKASIQDNIPLRRLGEAEDVAELVAFLSSDKAGYITGQVINVDGGMVM